MRTALLFLFLAACADPYADAEKVDTIEAWEKFLAEGASGADQLKAEARLEQLLIDRATTSNKVEDFDAAIKRFPKSRQLEKLQAGRATSAYAIAEAADTPEAWKAFLEENPTADGSMKKKATNRVQVAEYKSNLAIGELKIEEVNMANDPKGPKNGFGFTVEVKNNGDKVVDYLNLELQFLGEDGSRIAATSYPVAGTTGPGGLPLEEKYTQPLKPGESRTWNITAGPPPEGVDKTDGYIPQGWSKKANVVPVAIHFAAAP